MLKNKSLGLLESQEILEFVKWSDVYHKSSHNIILHKNVLFICFHPFP